MPCSASERSVSRSSTAEATTSWLSKTTSRGVWPKILAGLIRCGVEICPMQVPSVAVVEAVESHDSFGVGFVPTPAAAFEALRGGFALGLRGAAADLPTMTAELGIANRFLPLGHIAQELI